MSFRPIAAAQIRELLGRWQAGESLRAIAVAVGVDRKTVRRYVRVAEAVRIEAASSLDDDTLSGIMWVVRHRPGRVTEMQHALGSSREQIRACLAARMSLATIHLRLQRAGVVTSYATLRRFAIRELGWRARGPARLEAA